MTPRALAVCFATMDVIGSRDAVIVKFSGYNSAWKEVDQITSCEHLRLVTFTTANRYLSAIRRRLLFSFRPSIL